MSNTFANLTLAQLQLLKDCINAAIDYEIKKGVPYTHTIDLLEDNSILISHDKIKQEEECLKQ